MEKKRFQSALLKFADDLKKSYQSNIVANPEDQLKRPISELIESLFPGKIATKTEVRVEGLGARPDIGVSRNNLLCGHIELKAPNVSIKKFKGANKAQFEKFKALPNLIYTNGNEWAHYKSGEKVGSIVEFSSDIINDGSKAINTDQVDKLYALFYDFINWEPIVPTNPKALASILAPLCRLLRTDVKTALNKEGSTIQYLYKDWQRLFFPDADEQQFADAYAQTLTYALLLARLSGADTIDPDAGADSLDDGHSLLAQTLRFLGQKDAREEMKTAVDLLQRMIEAVDFVAISAKSDPWLYFYEDFLSIYDPKLRKDYGVYYTPIEVVECQVRLCAEILRDKFGKSLAYADDDVTFLDPATGTAAYPLTAIEHGLNLAAKKFGEGMIASIATRMASNFYAFEYMVGPYAVSHMRIAQALKQAGGTLPKDGIRVFLTDTLEDPETDPPRFSFAERTMAEEHIRAQKVKQNTNILVCMGNPPYDREQHEEDDHTGRRKGGWIRFGSNKLIGSLHNTPTETKGILKDFIDGAPSVHVKNLYNDYVYFWRWALWKMYENENTSHQGIVSFITASSYLKGPGFTSMRRKMREAFDELWIIDLEGDNLGARKTENVFNIQTPVAIAIGYRKEQQSNSKPAKTHYHKVTGTRAEKLAYLADVKGFDAINWQPCFSDWEKPMLPEAAGDYFSYPLMTDIFPWQHSGVQFKRKWPIASQKEVLIKRWNTLMNAKPEKRKSIFGKEGDRPITKDFKGDGLVTGGKKLNSLKNDTPIPSLKRYGYRSFDRHYCISDNRLASRVRPELWNSYSDKQVFIVSFLSGVLGTGPATSSTSHVPDLDNFRGSFGGKHVIPLWKDAAATIPNITNGVLKAISDDIGEAVQPEELFAYCYAVLAHPAYTGCFSEELSIPGPRVPITKDKKLFTQLSDKGKHLLYLHTYAERMVPASGKKGEVPPGAAKCTVAVPSASDKYPEDYTYDEASQTLKVGDGEFAPVSKAVYEFSISGWEVVKKWLAYRMKGGAGKKSSPLDDIRPEQWTAENTKELLELLWVLEHTIKEYPQLEKLLTKVVDSKCFTEDELPKPTKAETEPLKSQTSLY